MTTCRLEKSGRSLPFLPSPSQQGQNYRDQQQPFDGKSHSLLENLLSEQVARSHSAALNGGHSPEASQQHAASPRGDVQRAALPGSAEVERAEDGSNVSWKFTPLWWGLATGKQQPNTSPPSASMFCHSMQHSDTGALLQQQMLQPT